MAYLTRQDIPFHYALADAFTICDGYHCSLFGPTDPNRYHMWTGWVGNDGLGGGPVIDNAEAGYDWSTYPERLERNGISWKIYQDSGVGLDAAGSWGWTSDPYIGNYGDNSLLYFHQYQNAQPGDALYEKARRGTNIAVPNTPFDALFGPLRDDVRNNRLPQVSWIAAPEAFSEHGNWPANYGAWYIAQVLDALTSNPEVWGKTALFITYDENDGFFDHIVPPTPPRSAAEGASTVDTSNEIFPGSPGNVRGPYGLGIRVPMLVVSPWSKGGWVCSEVFDHTSLIRFLERRFAKRNADLIETNITAWRRAVCGDLTSAFNFANPNARPVQLPDTSMYVPTDHDRHPDYVPTVPMKQSLPKQERMPHRMAWPRISVAANATLRRSVTWIGCNVPMSLPLTLIVLTRNEAKTIGRCLDSVPFAIDKVVVDSGSTDGTPEIAAAHGARVIRQDWLGFGPQRNFATLLARYDWILVLDADEQLSPDLAQELEARLPSIMTSSLAGGVFRRAAQFMGAPMRWYRPMARERIARLYHRERARWTDARVHESLQFNGPVVVFQHRLLHDHNPTLVHRQIKMLRYTELRAQDWRDRGRKVRLWLCPFVFLTTFVKDYFFRCAFLDGWRGYIVAQVAASYAVYKRLRYYELSVNPASLAIASDLLKSE